MSNQTIPVVVLTINPRINQRIAPIVLEPQTLLTNAMKEAATDTASGGTWVNRTPRRVSQTGVNGSNPGDIYHTVRIVEPPSLFLIRTVYTSPPCSLNAIHQVANKRQSTPPALVGNTQKWTLLLTESCPMIWIMSPFSERSLTVPSVTSTSDVG